MYEGEVRLGCGGMGVGVVTLVIHPSQPTCSPPKQTTQPTQRVIYR